MWVSSDITPNGGKTQMWSKEAESNIFLSCEVEE